MPTPTQQITVMLYILLLCAISCDNPNKIATANQSMISDSILVKPGSKVLIKRVSTFNDGNEILITYFVSDTTDWIAIKTDLIEEREDILSEFPNIKTISLVCYTSLENTPVVKTNPIFAWNHQVNQYRACSLDNSEGKWRYSYGGTESSEESTGKWKKMDWL